MKSLSGPPFLWFVLTGLCFAAVFVFIRAITRRRLVPGGGIVNALRVTSIAPAFFVPAIMTTVIVGLGLAAMTRGSEPWLTGGPSGLLIHGVVCLVVAAGLAGQVGLLEAYRQSRPANSDAFLDGIRNYTLGICLAKVVILGTMAVLIRPGFNPARAFTEFQPFYRFSDRFNTTDIASWAVMLIPSFLLAPILGTVTLHPRRPLRSLLAALAATMRHPWCVLKVFTLQAAFATLAVLWLEQGLSWRVDVGVVRLAALTHGPALNFHLFPFLAFADRAGGPILAIMVPLSAVFVTAYWSIVAQREVVEAPAASV